MSGENSEAVNRAIKESRRYHTLYLRAINSPLRRKILRALRNGYTTIRELQSYTGLDEDVLKWHLDALEHGFCIEKNSTQGKRVYKLTQEGKVVDYLE